MDDGFQLHDPLSAQALLRSFSAAVRRKGESLVRSGAVRDLTVLEPGRAYAGVVIDGGERTVKVAYRGDEVDDWMWEGDCSCPREIDCEHVFAVFRELLASTSEAVVRNLSAGTPNPGDPSTAVTKPKRSTELIPLLTDALGRRLQPDENRFVAKLRKVFERCRQARHITYWDFEEMGLRLPGGYGWDGLKIWPAVPLTEHEFWLYVANAATERKVPIPGFMEIITELGVIQENIARWRRAAEIDRWKAALTNRGVTSVRAPDRGQTDLRLVIDMAELRLQWQRPGQVAFEPLKQNQARQIESDYGAGLVQFTTEAEWIWQAYGTLLDFGTSLRWGHHDQRMLRFLGRVLRPKLLESRIVTPSGQPLSRPPEPLKWQLDPAADANDDYRLRLVQADGSRLPFILAVVPGDPALYVTPDAILMGTASPDLVRDPTKETRIPAPALEVAGGVALIQELGLELPPRLQERVQRLQYQATIHCELRPTWAGSTVEECVVQPEASAPDGRRVTFDGYNWRESKPRTGRKGKAQVEMITLYDPGVLAEVAGLLQPLLLKPDAFGKGLTTRVTRKFPETFSQWLTTVPPHITVHLAGDLASFGTPNVAGRVKLNVTEAEIDWFDLRVVLDVSDATLSSEEIALLLKAKGSYVRLAGKGWRRLQFDLSDEENEQLARLGLSARELSAEPQRLHALQLADDAAKKFLPQQQVESLQRRATEIKTRVVPTLPSGVTADFRPYQLEGFHFLAYLSANRFGGILADDMGLGKTVQTLAWLMWLREAAPEATSPGPSGEQSEVKGDQTPSSGPRRGASLVICPKSVMDNWRAEVSRFTPGLRVRVWSPSELDQFHQHLDTADLHVLNYNQLRTLGPSLAAVSWLAVILDEGQYIKNPNSQTAQVARALRAQHRLVLSGTPIENRLLDLWSLMAFAMPGVLGNRAHFARTYDAKGDPLARRRLASRVRPFLLRRTKTQVAKDLPDRIEEDLFCEMEGEQKVLYQAELKRARQLLLGISTQKELAQQQFHFLVSLLRLRQICCDPRLLHPDSNATSAKLEALLEQIEPLMEEGQKVLVFSQFVELLGLLRPALTERKWPLFYLAGDTENRGELVRQFQAAPGPGIFLISLKAGGFGLNLTAASYVVLFDPWWNPAVENQAIDRTHRIGQQNKVIAYRLLIKNSIEEKIRALQKTKKALADDVLGEERFAQSLTLDDLHFLFAE